MNNTSLYRVWRDVAILHRWFFSAALCRRDFYALLGFKIFWIQVRDIRSLLSSLKTLIIFAVCLGSLSCWKSPLLPHFLRMGLIFHCTFCTRHTPTSMVVPCSYCDYPDQVRAKHAGPQLIQINLFCLHLAKEYTANIHQASFHALWQSLNLTSLCYFVAQCFSSGVFL